MKCQSCQQRDAKVHLTEILDNKEKQELHLCEQCAHTHQGDQMDFMSILSGEFGLESSSDPKASPELACPTCGLSYVQFRGRGRLGCEECYEAFQPALDPLLEKIHGGRLHVGKTPGETASGDRTRDRQLVGLRRKLREAVRDEDYEAAAVIRDELRLLEDGEGEEGDGEDQ